MAIFEWRKLNFFELKKEPVDTIATALQDADITAATNGNDLIVICDSNCTIHIFRRNWTVVSFSGHDTPVLFCKISRQNNLLVTLGNEDSGPTFKVWNLKKIADTGAPQCLRTVKTVVQRPTALGVSDGGQYMAIGFERGNISLYRGDIARDKSKTLKTLTAGTSAISGIEFKYTDKVNQMFVCSDSGVYLYTLHARDKETRTLLDTTAAPTRCCALQYGQKEGYFMIGRDNAVYCYTSDGRGPCYALESEKVLIQWFRTHLMAISKTKNIVSATQKSHTLTVIDIENKFIVFSSPIDNVAAILIEWGTCYIITVDKTIYHLDEKDLQSKLNILFKKNLYDIAVSVAKSSKYGADGLADIFKQYGDHLYIKGDFARSVDQYIKTIGFLVPSYVIRRFLDSRHIHHLTDYLQAVHEKGQASADHTTLLLNCFTRLDRTEQLREFVENERDKKSIFDVDVAIKVCRNACLELSLELAKKHHKHVACLSILTEDLRAYKEALQYISNLPFDDADKTLKKFGKVLMDNCPADTIELLKKLCTDYVSNHPEELTEEFLDRSSQVYRGNPEDFMHLFIGKPKLLVDFLEHLVLNISGCGQTVYDTLIEQYMGIWQADKTGEVRLMELIRSYGELYDKDHVLILCRMYEFWPGTLFLLEEDKQWHLVVRHYLQTGDYNNLLTCCKRLGSAEPGLWLQTLAGLRNDVNAPPHLLSQVLQVIAQEKLQSPLQVLSCLAVENGPKLASVRDYFLQVFQKETDSIRQEEKTTEQFRSDSVRLRVHIQNMQENPMEFRGTVCSSCCQPLNLPALHFLCQHSYHHDCVRGYSDTDKDCPICRQNYSPLCDTLRAQQEARGQHEQFHNILNRAPEPFSVVAEHFGRGLFNKIVIVDDDTAGTDDHAGDEQIVVTRTRKSIPAKTTTAPVSTPYGPGAEAKIRLQEGARGKIQPLQAVTSEGRLRMEERKPTNRDTYSSSLTANLTWPKPLNEPVAPVTMRPSTKISANLVNVGKPVAGATTATNPFDEDDDADTNYDESKNPFSEEDGGVAYDDKLNPFA